MVIKACIPIRSWGESTIHRDSTTSNSVSYTNFALDSGLAGE